MTSPLFRAITIVVVLRQELTYCRGILRGIKSFAESRPQWVLLSIPPEQMSPETLARIKPTGLIAHICNAGIVDAVVSTKRPFVNVSAALRDPPAPRVGVDDVACGRLAAEHLLDRGFRKFAFVGHHDQFFSVARERGFRNTLHAAGYSAYERYEAAAYPTTRERPAPLLWLDHDIHGWVRGLPRPCGLFAADDIWGL